MVEPADFHASESDDEKIGGGQMSEPGTRGPGLPVIQQEWQQMNDHIDRLQETNLRQKGQIRQLEQDRTVLFLLFVITSIALAYVIAMA